MVKLEMPLNIIWFFRKQRYNYSELLKHNITHMVACDNGGISEYISIEKKLDISILNDTKNLMDEYKFKKFIFKRNANKWAEQRYAGDLFKKHWKLLNCDDVIKKLNKK